MNLSTLQAHLQSLETLRFQLPNGDFVPAHFHITEIGHISKKFIDCGGAVHEQETASVQIWVAADVEHRLSPQGFLHIIDLSKQILAGKDLELVVEYQTETISQFGLDFQNGGFVLTPKHTDCLAPIRCDLPQAKPKIRLGEKNYCTPGSGCC
jgi:hypothetical protein